MQNKKGWLSLCFVFGLLLALSVQAAPFVSNVVGAQRAGTKLVDITYDLTDADHATLSVTIKISHDAGATWNVPCTSLSGDGIGPEVTPGKGKSIVWDAGADWNGQWSNQMKVQITATASTAPPASGMYMVVDLSMGPKAASFPVSYLDEAPGVGWPASGWPDEYKTTKLVLRRIPAGTFMMGSPADEFGRDDAHETQHEVTLTKDFYVGVFEVTQKQWELVVGTWPSWFNNTAYRDFRPVEQVSYDDIRGSQAGAGWPASNAVDAGSFLGRLRAKTGLGFDLPTEAQWEYACRAGTTTALNSGKNVTYEQECPNVAEVGRYFFNGGLQGLEGSQDIGISGGTAKVGNYRPNQWGLYDMHGNVFEWCLDWLTVGGGDPSGAVTDPAGGADGILRTFRGCCWGCYALYCRSAYRSGTQPSRQAVNAGFRLAFTIDDTAPAAPTAHDDAYATPVDTTLTVAAPGVLLNDIAPADNALTATLATAPAHGTLTLNPDGSFAYTPNQGFSGVDTFTYKASDGQADSGCATVTITVNTAGEYLVVDLSQGPEATSYPVSYLDEAPGGGWPVSSWLHEYKTTKLVLRKIPAGVFMMGSPEEELGREPDGMKSETQHQVTLTKDFYVGVFEVTQRQWALVMGTWPSWFSNAACRDTRPVENVSYDDIRGNNAGSGWPIRKTVDADSFLGRLRAKTGLGFELPTEAQWEYACRAGTATALNSEKNLTSENQCPNVAEVGRYWYNGGKDQGAGIDASGGTAMVGSYWPNLWGLYDMHGNVLEWCLDWWDEASGNSSQPMTNPTGAPDGTQRIIRGGGWGYDAQYCRSAYRWYSHPSEPRNILGFRLTKMIQ